MTGKKVTTIAEINDGNGGRPNPSPQGICLSITSARYLINTKTTDCQKTEPDGTNT